MRTPLSRRGALSACAAVVALTIAGSGSAKGSESTAITVGYGSVWIGNGNGSVAQVAESTNRVVRRVEVGGFVSSLATSFGSLWVMTDRGVVRVDPRTGKARTASVAFASGGGRVVASGGALWLTSGAGDRLARFDPRTMRVKDVPELPGRITWIGESGGRLWVVYAPGSGPMRGPRGTRYLTEILKTPVRPTRWRIRLSCDAAAAVVGTGLLVADACGSLARFTLLTHKRTATVAGIPATALTAHAGYVWQGGNGVDRVHPRTLKMRRMNAIKGVTAFGRSADSLWALVPARGLLVRLDHRSGRALAEVRLSPG